MVDANTTTPNTTGPAEGATSAGPVQAPDATHVAALSPESRKAIFDKLSFQYPAQKGELAQWYGQAAVGPATLAEQFDASNLGSMTAASEVDLGEAQNILVGNGMTPTEAAESLGDLRTVLGEMGLPPVIASSVGNEMARTVNRVSEMTPDERNANWAREKEIVLRIAKAPWETVRDNVRYALDRMSADHLGDIAASGALDSAQVITQLNVHGARLKAREAMTKAK